MKVYNENGDSMNAAKEQMDHLLDNGWSRTKPETEEEKRAKIDAEELADKEAKEAADKEVEELADKEAKEAADKEAKELADNVSADNVSAPKKVVIKKSLKNK